MEQSEYSEFYSSLILYFSLRVGCGGNHVRKLTDGFVVFDVAGGPGRIAEGSRHFSEISFAPRNTAQAVTAKEVLILTGRQTWTTITQLFEHHRSRYVER